MQVRIPFQYRPIALHWILASILATGLLIAGVLGIGWLETYRDQKSEELTQQFRQRQSTVQRGAVKNPDLLYERLPAIQIAEQLNRDITGLAAAKNIRLNSLQIEKAPGTTSTHSSVIYRLAAEATYIDTKKWLGELLTKYDTLGVRELSIAEETNEASVRSVDITLVLYVQN